MSEISYKQMCAQEGGTRLQRGMNFHLSKDHSVILMSTNNGPYEDELENNGSILIYEGHDVSRRNNSNPKLIDQPMKYDSGRLTENGKFFNAVKEYKAGKSQPEKVKVYEKIQKGTWKDLGIFFLTDSWIEQNKNRKVFKFKLEKQEDEK